MKQYAFIFCLFILTVVAENSYAAGSRDILEYSLPDSPEQLDYPNNPNPYANTWEDLGWTSVDITETGNIDFIHLTGSLFSDSYPAEGSLWLMAPDSNLQLIDDSFVSGTSDVDYTINAFNGYPCSGQWILFFEDDYGDGGHALNNGVFRVITVANVHNITQDIYYDEIQTAINAAVDNDVIILSPGTYSENINFNGKAITLASLFHTTQDSSYIPITIIDGGQNDSVVKFNNGETETSVLTGLTVTGGSAYSGGGILCNNSSPVLQNLMVVNNSTSFTGGGICCFSSNPSIINVNIDSNTSDFGGGLGCHESSPFLQNTVVTGNSAEYGGGMYLTDAGNPVFEDVLITANTGDYGGGVLCEMYSSLTADNITISNNNAEHGGGIIVAMNSNLIMDNSLINGNNGGGFWLEMGSQASVQRTVICNNSNILDDRCGVYCYDSQLDLSNVTIADNEQSGLVAHDSDVLLVNCILWNNNQEISYDAFDESLVIAYSDIMGGFEAIENYSNSDIQWLDGNIDANPLFQFIAQENYHLTSNSPCLDAGTAYLEFAGQVLIDLDEELYQGAAPDMGAYEHEDVIVYADIDDNGEVDCYDVSLIMMLLVGMDPLPDDPVPWINWRFLRADVDLNGEINSMDSSYILQFIVELLETLPVTE